MAVRWDYWRNIPVVEVYDAVLLSVGIEPSGKSADNMEFYLDGYEVGGKLKRAVGVVRDRIAIACANLECNGGEIPVHKRYPYVSYPQVEADKHTQVRLSDFWGWAESMGWSLPEGANFATIDKPAKATTPPKETATQSLPISELLATKAFNAANEKGDGVAGMARTIIVELAQILTTDETARLGLQTLKGNNPILRARGFDKESFRKSHYAKKWAATTFSNKWQQAFTLIGGAAVELAVKESKKNPKSLASLADKFHKV